MLKSDLDALLASLGRRPEKPAGVHDWGGAVDAPYCVKCGATKGTRRAVQECAR